MTTSKYSLVCTRFCQVAVMSTLLLINTTKHDLIIGIESCIFLCIPNMMMLYICIIYVSPLKRIFESDFAFKYPNIRLSPTVCMWLFHMWHIINYTRHSYMFHATRKHGHIRKHVTGLFNLFSHVATSVQMKEIIIKWYHGYVHMVANRNIFYC